MPETEIMGGITIMEERYLLMFTTLMICIYALFITAILFVCAVLFLKKYDKKGWMYNYIALITISASIDFMINQAISPLHISVSEIFRRGIYIFFATWELIRVIKATAACLKSEKLTLKIWLESIREKIYMLIVIMFVHSGMSAFAEFLMYIEGEFYSVLINSRGFDTLTIFFNAAIPVWWILLMEKFTDCVNNIYYDSNGDPKIFAMLMKRDAEVSDERVSDLIEIVNTPPTAEDIPEEILSGLNVDKQTDNI